MPRRCLVLILALLASGCSAVRTPPPTASGFTGGAPMERGEVEGTGVFGSGVLTDTRGLPGSPSTATAPSLLFGGSVDLPFWHGLSVVMSGGIDMDSSFVVASGRVGFRSRFGPMLVGLGGGGGSFVPWNLPYWFAGGEVGAFAPLSDMIELATHVRVDFSTPSYDEPANTGTWAYVQPTVYVLVGERDGPARFALGVGGHLGGQVPAQGWATGRIELRVGVVARTKKRKQE